MKAENWHRRHAVQIVCALPEDTEDAQLVLRLATQLVTGFLAESETAPKPAPVIALAKRFEP